MLPKTSCLFVLAGLLAAAPAALSAADTGQAATRPNIILVLSEDNGPRGSSYGCMGGMIRLPGDGLDILLYSNLDTDAGQMPDRVGASITQGREKITVWAGGNGGQTWPVKRLVFAGPSGYSNLAAGRAGTPSAGKIYLLFEGGAGGRRSGIQVAVFNLSWLLNGAELPNLF